MPGLGGPARSREKTGTPNFLPHSSKILAPELQSFDEITTVGLGMPPQGASARSSSSVEA